MKQYIVEEAYMGNNTVTLYNNGKLESYDIISNYETYFYCKTLERQGYTRAYDLSEYEEAMKEAIEQYNMAKESPLIKL